VWLFSWSDFLIISFFAVAFFAAGADVDPVGLSALALWYHMIKR
jgi:hypothetical protein